MKFLFLFFGLLMVINPIFAQPQKINYQGVAVGANGKPLKNSTVGLRLSVLDSLPTGSTIYTETQAAITDTSGQFSIFLGGGTAMVGTFSNILWANGNDKFLKVEMDVQGGSNYQLMGTTQLVSVPYAMAAKTADLAKELQLGALIRGNAGRIWQLTESINGPMWTCYPPLTMANAGADQLNVCASSVILAGNTPSNGTAAWSILSGSGGSLGTANAPATSFAGVRGSSYSLRYSISNACGSSADTVSVSLAPTTTPASAGPDQLTLTGTTATLAANALAAGETGAWSIVAGSGGSLSASNNPATTFTKGTDSAYTLVWTITATCGTSRDTVKLRFPVPVATPCGQAVTYVGESYPTVRIGTQCWLAKNLNVGSMINGSSNQTNNSSLEKYCYNNNLANCTTYGGLYQWAEAVQYQNGASNTTTVPIAFAGNVRGICPTGWHIPSDAEYCTLATFLDATANCVSGTNSTTAGGKLKSTSGLWAAPNTGATNSTGFSALPGGYRFTNATFTNLGTLTYFWSTSEFSSSDAIFRGFSNTNSDYSRIINTKSIGLSVRCIQD
jgi:uncharacterized protein (TIGR02145 family)